MTSTKFPRLAHICGYQFATAALQLESIHSIADPTVSTRQLKLAQPVAGGQTTANPLRPHRGAQGRNENWETEVRLPRMPS